MTSPPTHRVPGPTRSITMNTTPHRQPGRPHGRRAAANHLRRRRTCGRHRRHRRLGRRFRRITGSRTGDDAGHPARPERGHGEHVRVHPGAVSHQLRHLLGPVRGVPGDRRRHLRRPDQVVDVPHRYQRLHHDHRAGGRVRGVLPVPRLRPPGPVHLRRPDRLAATHPPTTTSAPCTSAHGADRIPASTPPPGRTGGAAVRAGAALALRHDASYKR